MEERGGRGRQMFGLGGVSIVCRSLKRSANIRTPGFIEKGGISSVLGNLCQLLNIMPAETGIRVYPDALL